MIPTLAPTSSTASASPILALGLAVTTLLCGCACPHRKAETSRVIEWFTDRPDGLTTRETWRDAEGGGGLFIFTDPTVQSMSAIHSNQCSLGGGSVFTAGPMAIIVDTNLTPALAATGTAVGNILGAAVKSAAK